MTVYKCHMKILKRNLGLVIMYLAIFFSITMFIQAASRKEGLNDYQQTRISIAICDRDHSALSDGLIQYLSNIHQVSMIQDDLAVMQEELFYRNVEYIIQIPENFYDSCILQGTPLSVTRIPGSYSSYYVDQQINSYLNSVKTYMAAGFSLSEASSVSVEQNTATVHLLENTGNNSGTPAYTYYFRYIPYLFLGSLCYSMGYILMAFRNEDIRKRMAASSVSLKRQNLEGFLAMFTVGIGLWLISMSGAVLLFKKDFCSLPFISYYLLNSLLILVISLSLAYLTGLFVKNSDMLNGLSNILSLGMCFLCGVFVPMNVMNPRVLKVSQFLPVYWYEKVNDLLGSYHVLPTNRISDLWKYLGIEFLYAIAVLTVIMAVSKYKKQG